jgi:60 kDa SS-A/Ro ribonucleoprotein
VNKNLLGAKRSTADVAKSKVAVADTTNRAGGKAISYDSKTAAAVFAMTSTFPDAGGTHQMDGNAQLTKFREHLADCESDFVAKLAVYARRNGKMKDAPLVAILHLLKQEGDVLGEKSFQNVVDNPVQYRNAAALVMSGLFGTRSFGSRLARIFNTRLFDFGIGYLTARGLVGNDPSLADVIRMTHPSAKSQGDARGEWEQFFKYVLGRDGWNIDLLPKALQDYERFKGDPLGNPIPKGLEILQVMGMLPKEGDKDVIGAKWAEVASRMSWTQLFKNLATLHRHGAFDVGDTEVYVANMIRDREKVLNSRQFAYAIYNAYQHLSGISYGNWGHVTKGEPKVPLRILEALQDALDISAVGCAPRLDAQLAIGIDTSGSMFSPVTGIRKGATSTAMKVGVAALLGASAYKQNPTSLLLPFDDVAKRLPLTARDTVATIANQICQSGGGGTNVSDVFSKVLEETRRNPKFRPDAILLLSDMQTWVEGSGIQCWGSGWGTSRGTAANELYEVLKAETGKPVKLVCWNLASGEDTQASGESVLNIGGWSEALWQTVSDFLCGEKAEVTEEGVKVSPEANAQKWIEEIEAIDLDALDE